MPRLSTLLQPNPTNPTTRCNSIYLKRIGVRYKRKYFIDYCKSMLDLSLEEACSKCMYFDENIRKELKCLG